MAWKRVSRFSTTISWISVALKLGKLQEVVRLNENEPGVKTRKYFEKNRDGKLLLRHAMAQFCPPNVTEAEKQGFSAPDASWFRGDSIDYVRRVLLSPNARLYQFLDADATQALINEHISGASNRRLFIWSLLQFEQWCKTFLQ